MVLQVTGISKCFGDDCVLDRISFTVQAGERVGLIGPNGSGKTTLLDIIVGRQEPDDGSVRLAANARLGYLEQGLTFAQGDTVGEAILGAQGELAAAQRRLTDCSAELASMGQADAQAVQQFADAQAHLEALGGLEFGRRARTILDGLGLREVSLESPVAPLSGGQKTRLGLASLLLRQPSLLLLDEPTNHLDIAGLEWLEEFLQHFAGAMIVVSHDRAFLDRTVQSILELNSLTHRIRPFSGNYSEYVRTVAHERDRQAQAYREQQEYIADVTAALRGTKGRAKRTENATIDFYYRKRAKKVARAAVVRERRLQRMLDSEKRVDKPALTWKMKMDLVDTPVSGQKVLTMEDVGHRFGEMWLFRGVNMQLQRGERVAVIGANGSGKSTLLKVVAGQLWPLEGTVRLGTHVRVGYYAQEQEGLAEESTPFEEIRSVSPLSDTEARNFLHYYLFAGDDVFVPVGDLSYGERARLALAKLVLAGSNLLLLDEPLNHLDIPSRESFEQALSSFEGTVLIVVHDRQFIRNYAQALWSLEDGTVRRYVELDAVNRNRGTEDHEA